MARYSAITAVGEAICGLLDDSRPAGVFPTARSVLVLPKQFRNGADPLAPPGFAVLLYRVAVSGGLRNRTSRVAPDGSQFKPSLPLDLHYLLFPWGGTAEEQHLLLGWAMRALEDNPVLHASLLNDYASDPATFSAGESVDLISDPLPVGEMNNAQEAIKPHVQLAAAYIARTVLIDSEVPVHDFDLVQAREFAYAPGIPAGVPR